MAKKTNPEENRQEQEVPAAVREETVQEQPELQSTENGNEEKDTEDTVRDGETAEAGSPWIQGLLRLYPSYPSLFIDSRGGTFTPDTAKALRGDAVLYRNPYYNKSKTKS
jgi:hypothetical protein